MKVEITGDLLAFVNEKLASGQYASAEEIVEAALLELRNIETGEFDARWLNAKIETGIASLEVEGGIPADEAFERIRRMIEYRRSKVES